MLGLALASPIGLGMARIPDGAASRALLAGFCFAGYLAVPRGWSASSLLTFMLCIGPISSIFDIATFALLWWGLGASGLGNRRMQRGFLLEMTLAQLQSIPPNLYKRSNRAPWRRGAGLCMVPTPL